MLQRLRLCRTSDTVFRREIDSRRQWGYGTCYGGIVSPLRRSVHYDSHVSDMLAQLQWETLEHRRWKSRFTMFYKIQFGLVAIPLPEFIVRPERPRPGHPHQFQRIYCRTDAYKYSFFPFAIKQWNAIPTSTACQSTLPLFQGDLSSLSP